MCTIGQCTVPVKANTICSKDNLKYNDPCPLNNTVSPFIVIDVRICGFHCSLFSRECEFMDSEIVHVIKSKSLTFLHSYLH